jgi:hypothetical protein
MAVAELKLPSSGGDDDGQGIGVAASNARDRP